MPAVLKEVSGMSDGEVAMLSPYCLYANFRAAKVFFLEYAGELHIIALR
jgi:hypothetical protein